MVRKFLRVLHRVLFGTLVAATLAVAALWVASFGLGAIDLPAFRPNAPLPSSDALNLRIRRGQVTLRHARLITKFPREVRRKFKRWHVRQVREEADGYRTLTLSRGKPKHRSFGPLNVEYEREWVITEASISPADLLRMRDYVFQSRADAEPGLIRADFLSRQIRVVVPIWVPFAALAAYPASLCLLCGTRGALRRYIRHRRRIAGRCIQCGEDLIDSPKEACPRCGFPVGPDTN